MTKEQFVKKVADATGVSQREVDSVIDSALDTITDALKSGDHVTFVGFGKFHAVKRAGRQGINPQTRQPLYIEPSTGAKFTAGSKLKAALNG